MSNVSPAWEKHKADIICDFESGMSDYAIGKKYNVTRPTIKAWRSKTDYLLLPPPPPGENTKLMRETIDMLPTKRFLEEQAVIIDTTEKFKEKGMRFLNNAIDRMEDLLATTKDIRAIAAGLNVLLPYLMARVDGEGDLGGNFEARRNAFIQNVQNNYNIKLNKDETIEDIGNYGDST